MDERLRFVAPLLDGEKMAALCREFDVSRARPVIKSSSATRIAGSRFAGQNVGVKEVSDRIWLVSFMDYDLGFFDHETGRLGSAENPFAAKVLPMSPV